MKGLRKDGLSGGVSIIFQLLGRSKREVGFRYPGCNWSRLCHGERNRRNTTAQERGIKNEYCPGSGGALRRSQQSEDFEEEWPGRREQRNLRADESRERVTKYACRRRRVRRRDRSWLATGRPSVTGCATFGSRKISRRSRSGRTAREIIHGLPPTFPLCPRPVVIYYLALILYRRAGPGVENVRAENPPRISAGSSPETNGRSIRWFDWERTSKPFWGGKRPFG